MAELFSIAVVFFLIMDPLGNIPLFLAVLKDVDPKRHLIITSRELLIAYVALLGYLFAGRFIIDSYIYLRKLFQSPAASFFSLLRFE